jgi:glutathione S-transferase
MSGMIIHGISGSPYVRSALMVLEEKGARYDFAGMAFGAQKQHPHLSRQPFGRIPALEHDGWVLYETQAILRYVDAVLPGPKLQPENARGTARMNQLMGIVDCYFAPQVTGSISFQRLVAPQLGLPVDEDAIAKAIPNARTCVAEISRLAEGRRWLAGDAISLADLLLAPQLSAFALTPEGETILMAHGTLTGWLACMEARPSMRATTSEALKQRVVASI